MFNAKSQNLILMILMVALLAELVALLLKPTVQTVLAQSGGTDDAKMGNAAAWQQAVKSGNVTMLDASAFTPVTIADETIGPQSDGSGIEVMSNGAFRNDGDSVDGWFNLFSGGYIQNNGSNAACFMAPVYPPNGATLTQFRLSLLDQSSDKNLQFLRLHRVRLATGAVNLVAGGGPVSWNSPTAIELYFTGGITPGTEVVSNAYAYYVDLCFDPASSTDILFYGARLFYTP